MYHWWSYNRLAQAGLVLFLLLLLGWAALIVNLIALVLA